MTMTIQVVCRVRPDSHVTAPSPSSCESLSVSSLEQSPFFTQFLCKGPCASMVINKSCQSWGKSSVDPCTVDQCWNVEQRHNESSSHNAYSCRAAHGEGFRYCDSTLAWLSSNPVSVSLQVVFSICIQLISGKILDPTCKAHWLIIRRFLTAFTKGQM